MTEYIISVDPYGKTELHPYDAAEEIPLEDLQRLVGGYIETVPGPAPDTLVIVDDDGKYKAYLINLPATALLMPYLVSDYFVGTVVLAAKSGEEIVGFDLQTAERWRDLIENSVMRGMLEAVKNAERRAHREQG